MRRLTDEQNGAVDLFGAGGDLKIFAFAGTGKTRTLEAMAAEATGSALYLAFNRSIAAEARGRFPGGTTCSTVHALAFRALRSEFGPEELTEALTLAEIVEVLGIEDRLLGAGELSARAQAALVRATMERFLLGLEAEPSDVPLSGGLLSAPAGQCVELVEETLARARQLWAQMVDPCNPVPLGHDGCLKLWALGRPKLEADHIFLDEAQDTNAVVFDLLRRQAAQTVYVGDAHQRIYGWRGAIDVMSVVPATAAHLTQSFRFGEAIAAVASRVVASLGERRRVEGNPRVASAIGYCAPDAVIARTNAGVVDAVLDALMIGERPYVEGGTGDLVRLLIDVERLKEGRGAATPELAGFARWSDVVEASFEPGAGLGTLVALVEEHGENRLIAALAKVARDEAKADLVVTTAHRAKGREWDHVQLRDDFGRSIGLEGGGAFDPAEARLFYVALTRARLGVDAPPDLIDFYAAEEAERASA